MESLQSNGKISIACTTVAMDSNIPLANDDVRANGSVAKTLRSDIGNLPGSGNYVMEHDFSYLNLMFEEGTVYKRSDIHDIYGGNRQNGISTSTKFPYIFIFSGGTGHSFGYKDGWDNHKVFSYTGEGQVGNMKFVRGNLALREHLSLGKRVFLFQIVRKSYVQFVSELELFDWDFFVTEDRNDQIRNAIRFFFKRKGEMLDIDTGLVAEPPLLYHTNVPNVTEREGLITSRVGQGAYRKSILHRWEYKCAVTGYTDVRTLIASHIVPWSKSNNHERLDIHNGILLSPTYDALFDRRLISFDDSGKIMLSKKLQEHRYQKIGVTGKEKILNLSDENHTYLERHRLELL